MIGNNHNVVSSAQLLVPPELPSFRLCWGSHPIRLLFVSHLNHFSSTRKKKLRPHLARPQQKNLTSAAETKTVLMQRNGQIFTTDRELAKSPDVEEANLCQTATFRPSWWSSERKSHQVLHFAQQKRVRGWAEVYLYFHFKILLGLSSLFYLLGAI